MKEISIEEVLIDANFLIIWPKFKTLENYNILHLRSLKPLSVLKFTCMKVLS